MSLLDTQGLPHSQMPQNSLHNWISSATLRQVWFFSIRHVTKWNHKQDEWIYATQYEPDTANIWVLNSWEMDPNSTHCHISSFKIRTRSQRSLLLHILSRDRSKGKKQRRKCVEDWQWIISFSHINSNVKKRQSTPIGKRDRLEMRKHNCSRLRKAKNSTVRERQHDLKW